MLAVGAGVSGVPGGADEVIHTHEPKNAVAANAVPTFNGFIKDVAERWDVSVWAAVFEPAGMGGASRSRTRRSSST